MAFHTSEYVTLKARYPEQVSQIEQKILRGKSKHKKDRPDTFTWGFSWCVSVGHSYDLREVLAGLPQQDQLREEQMSEGQRVDDYAHRCHVTIAARKGKTTWTAEDIIATPPELLNEYRRDLRERKAEEARVAALSPEEREAEMQAALAQLRGAPGFIELTIPTRRRT